MQVNWSAAAAVIAGVAALTAGVLGWNTYRLAKGSPDGKDGAAAVTSEGIGRCRALGSAGKLAGECRLVFVFTDDPGADPWTPERRATVEQHVVSALRWLERQAKARGVELRWKHAFAPAEGAALSPTKIDEKDRAAGPHHSTWQNGAIASLLGKSGSVATLWEDIFARYLPEEGAVAGRAVAFGVRRYVPSVSFPFFRGDAAEFEKERAIIYDNGGPKEGQRALDSLIAHELLHLFGAIDLDPPKLPASALPFKDAIVAHTKKDDDVMGAPNQKPIDGYEVGELTAWLVGWKDEAPAWLKTSR